MTIAKKKDRNTNMKHTYEIKEHSWNDNYQQHVNAD